MEKTPIDTLSEIFGTRHRLALAMGISQSLLTRWSKPGWQRLGRDGCIPASYNQIIRIKTGELLEKMDATDEEKKAIAGRIDSCLDDSACPACGQPMPETRTGE